jgi:hypothetical protein
MIRDRTVIILGAGASRPYGFPSAHELRDEVVRTSGVAGTHIHELGFDYGQYGKFVVDLTESGYESVDAFLEDRQKYVEIGKAAIALNMLRFEIGSRLFPPKQPKDHWYEVLWYKMKAPTCASFKKNALAVVTFNYDRSLEHYLATVACNNYGVKLVTAAQGLRSLPILHVHGMLGEYAAPPLADYPYGWRSDSQMLDTARNSIRIVHESDASSPEFQKAHELLKNAKKILFVGFGYRESNMNKLGLRPLSADANRHLMAKVVRATHKGFSSSQWKDVCYRYGFPKQAESSGTGSMSDFLSEWL